MAHGGSRTDGFVGALRILLLFKCVRILRKIVGSVFLADVLPDFRDGLRRNPGGVGTHVGDETDGAFFAEFHAFVEALRDHHGALDAEAKLAGRILLQLTGREWRSGIATALFFVDGTNDPVRLFQGNADLLCVLAIGDFNLLFALAHKAGVKCRRLGSGEVRVDGPVLFFLERLDLAFALDDQTESNGLHASGGKATTDFIPEERRNLISDQTIEHTARLLRVDKILIDGTGMLESGLHGTLRDLVEGHALNARRSLRLTFFGLLRSLLLFSTVLIEFESQVGGDSFAFAVRVRREIDGVGGGGKLLQLGDNFFFSRDDDVVSLEVI